MSTRTRIDCNKQNLFVKVLITALLALGIFCAIFAIRSCRWFVFKQDKSSENPLFLDWSFLPDSELRATITVGIFRYQPLYNFDVDGNDAKSPVTVPSLEDTTAGNDIVYSTFRNEQCVWYPDFWIGVDHPWKFTAQLCSPLGSLLGFASWCVMIAGADHRWICMFFMFSAGLQCATIISSLSWCDQYRNCPWLMGALINLVSTFLFLSCWALAMWGLVEVKTTRRRSSNPNRDTNTNEQQSRKKCQNPVRNNNSNCRSTAELQTNPSSVIVADDKNEGNRNDESTIAPGDRNRNTDDVERGPNTIPLYHTDKLSQESEVHVFESSSSDDDCQCSISDNELYYDASFEEGTNSTTERKSQSYKILQDQNTTLKECRRSATNDMPCSDDSDDNETSSNDASSTDSEE